MTSYRGNGVMALVPSDARHAEAPCSRPSIWCRLEEFNRPRQVLGLPLFHLRIGINSGDVLLGNVGTYAKMDFTALGATVNLAGVVERGRAGPAVHQPGDARPGARGFVDKQEGPRTVTFMELGPVEMWDVVKRKG